jgi:hypothetical protein
MAGYATSSKFAFIDSGPETHTKKHRRRQLELTSFFMNISLTVKDVNNVYQVCQPKDEGVFIGDALINYGKYCWCFDDRNSNTFRMDPRIVYAY